MVVSKSSIKVSPASPSTTSHPNTKAPTATAATSQARTAGTCPAHQATASTRHGTTTTICRPGHIHSCMDSATNVAVSQPASSGAASASHPGGRRRSERGERGHGQEERRLPGGEAEAAVDQQPGQSLGAPAVVGIEADGAELAGDEVVTGGVGGPAAVPRLMRDQVHDRRQAEPGGERGERAAVAVPQPDCADRRQRDRHRQVLHGQPRQRDHRDADELPPLAGRPGRLGHRSPP